ncbi:WD40/YVTN/BNR-like repeat-containing protein [Sulfuritalea sp.]|uniref:WD40/YVTN/BNR-like repeat-containing protein n=1 Tax=Sulfuritalea sp. TaxID=2480090 RepID=UPI00286E4A28|nr:YCF48-related protein [Sulfuritalea sp.]
MNPRLLLAFGFLLGLPPAVPAAAPGAALTAQAAVASSYAGKAPVLAAARAGKRVVSVGDYGTVMISDGGAFRQAREVPVNSTLTAVTFVDDKFGWAVGHWGAILHTADGGETWTRQRLDTTIDRPLFSVHFIDRNHGVAVGLWSLLLTTEDGGKSWNSVSLPKPPDGGRGDRNLFKVFGNRGDVLYVAAERGTVLRSADRGATWTYLDTGYKGSLWTGLVLHDGSLVVAGLRGTAYRSVDDGKSWSQAMTHTKSSITDLVESGNTLWGVGLDGVTLSSSDAGVSFVARQRDDRLALTAAVVAGDGALLTFSKRGLVLATER